ncbi:E3 ubiquitin-protein ligase MGRN1 [Bienertia sinuspersici]
MNATSISRDDLIADNVGDSDSDTNSDEISDYYQPISSIEGGEDPDANNPMISNGFLHHAEIQHNSIINGHDYSAENGLRSLDLSEDDEERESEEDEEDERRRVEMESAMWKAFEEDESRRNAPLSTDNATRVMEAMRGISFSGSTPDWVHHVPEDNWVDRLQRIRQPPHSRA